MKKLLAPIFFAGLFSLVTSVALADVGGMNISGAAIENPAFLGFSPVITGVASGGASIPGISDLEGFLNDHYNEQTKELNVVLDFTSKQKAEETMATLDNVLNSLSGLNAEAVAGISLGRIGLGATAFSEVRLSSQSQVVDDASDPDGFVATLNTSGQVKARADAMAILGIPIGKVFAVGASAKIVGIADANPSLQLNSDQISDMVNGDSAATPFQGSVQAGQGVLFDVGAAIRLKGLTIDAAVKDIGQLEWVTEDLNSNDPAPGIVANEPADEPASMQHYAAGVTLRPIQQLGLGVRYDQSPFGCEQVKASVEVAPFKFIALKTTYITDPTFSDGIFKVDGSLNLWLLGLSVGATIKDNVVTGGSARVSIGF